MNMMILKLTRLHGNFVQQMVTKFNDCDFSKCKYVQGIELQSQIKNLHLLLLLQKLLVHVCIPLPFQTQ